MLFLRLEKPLVILGLTLAAACGPTDVRTGLPPSRASLPEELAHPPLLSAVGLGSRDVLATVAPGPMRGHVLLELLAEPGAKILYALHAFAADTAEAELTLYQSPLDLRPPFVLTAIVDKDGARGPVRSFAYSLDPSAYAPAAAVVAERLFGDGSPFVPYRVLVEAESLPSLGAAERSNGSPVVDGELDEWTGAGRLRTRDGIYDVTAGKGYLDIAWSEVGETEEALFVAWALRETPKVADGVVYGFEVGPSNIGLSSFGTGAEFRYRAEIDGGKLRLYAPKSGEEVALSAGSVAAFGVSGVELKLLRSDLPLLEADAVELTARTYTSERGPSYTLSDRMQPVFLRSRFTLVRQKAAAPNAAIDLTFLQPVAGDLGDASLASSYLALAEPLVRELEAVNQIPFYERGTFPLYFVDKEENGYAGLNTTDRGMLTTIGQNTSLMSRVQLLAHELAHFQNARASKITARWLQEGMSEWSSERVLYRHFPRRAVHKYLRKIRFDRYFDTLGGELDDFALDTWGGEVARAGYEKSLMFFDMLETIVGQGALVKAFQLGVNVEMGSLVFQRFLERESGKDLGPVFKHWVFPGTPEPAYDPRALFGDSDADDLSLLDERAIGTDPAKRDTDGDGDLDSEEFFRGQDPLASRLDPEGALRGRAEPELASNFGASTDTSAFFRLAGDPEASWTWSLDPFAATPEQPYALPKALRPPFTVRLQGKLRDSSSAVTSATRGLYVGGALVPTPAPTVAILPPAPRQTITFSPAITLPALPYSSAPDVADDLPRELSPYDLTSARATVEASAVTIVFETRAAPDLYGSDGTYQAIFQSIDWVTSSPILKRHHAFVLASGEPYFSTLVGETETATRLDKGVTVTYSKDQIVVRLDRALLEDWLATSGVHQACLSSELTLEANVQVTDRGPCVDLTNTVRRAMVPDAFGLGPHAVDLTSEGVSAPRREAILKLAATAIVQFETVLARPLFERHHWPLRVKLRDGGATDAAANAFAGAYLTIDRAVSDATIDYLVVEQLARLVVADLLENQGSAPYWVQEMFIQWLTSAALYRMYPSREVHAFHAGRLEDLKCYLGEDPVCADFYGQDTVLSRWDFSTLDSTGSVRSLLFALELDALVGTEAMARAMSLYANEVPSAERLLSVLKGYAPAEAQLLTELFASYVFGTASLPADQARVLAGLTDADGDGLYVVEETKLGTSDASPDPYLQ